MITSKIATIVYANYTENVDMLNPLFQQSELDTLLANDKDIIRVDYYVNGKLCLLTKKSSSRKYSNIAIEITGENTCTMFGINYEYTQCEDDIFGKYIYAYRVNADSRSNLMLKVL